MSGSPLQKKNEVLYIFSYVDSEWELIAMISLFLKVLLLKPLNNYLFVNDVSFLNIFLS